MNAAYTSSCEEFGLTLPDSPSSPPIRVESRANQIVHVYGVGMIDTVLWPGDTATFAPRMYWWPWAALRAMFGLPIYRWCKSPHSTGTETK